MRVPGTVRDLGLDAVILRNELLEAPPCSSDDGARLGSYRLVPGNQEQLFLAAAGIRSHHDGDLCAHADGMFHRVGEAVACSTIACYNHILK